MMDVYCELFDGIMHFESLFAKNDWPVYEASDIYKIAVQIIEFGKNSFVLRGYNGRYGLTMLSQSCAYESDGAHTNLFAAIVDRYISFFYGEDCDTTSLGYTYREIMEAIRRHDLPENVIGDIPDNGSGNAAEKHHAEQIYHKFFSEHSHAGEFRTEPKIRQLLHEMETRSTPAGKMLYVADKVSANIITLCYDLRGTEPRMKLDDPRASERDKKEMALCDDKKYGSCRASEMWTVDFLRERKITQYDECGFFTALLVMVTVIAHDEDWYSWRVKDYANFIP